MKPKALTNVCHTYCRYYKPAQDDDLACMGFLVTEKLIARGFPVSSPDISGPQTKTDKIIMPNNKTAGHLRDQICKVCPFSENDCDYIDSHRSGLSVPIEGNPAPCGGFIFLGLLIDRKVIDINDISQVIQA